MLQVSQDIHLCYYLLLFFVIHFAVIELFPDENAAVRHPPHLTNQTKAAYTTEKTLRFKYVT